jgi:uncharacterized protein
MEEKVFIENSKGLKLASIINFPDKYKKYPAVIILHGFTGYKEEAHLKELADVLAKSGFAAIRFDCSGSGESGGTFEKDYLMSNYLEDIKSVYEYVRKLKFVDKDRISIVGHSMGGLMSIVFASINPNIKVCVAVSSPSIMITANWIKGAIDEWKRLGWFYKKISRDNSNAKIPFSFIADSNKYNAIDFAKKLHCPFLTVLGLSDSVVNPGDSRKIFRAANEPKELAEIAGIGHDYKKDSQLIRKVNERILDFLNRYLYK